MNLNSALDACFYIEPVAGCFNASDVVLSTVTMTYGSGSIPTTGSAAPGDDCPTNSIPDLKACFSKADLNTLFGSVIGTVTVTVTIEGSTTTGCKFKGSSTFDVKQP